MRLCLQARVKTGTIRAIGFQSSDGTNMWDESTPNERYKYLLLLVYLGAYSYPRAHTSDQTLTSAGFLRTNLSPTFNLCMFRDTSAAHCARVSIRLFKRK